MCIEHSDEAWQVRHMTSSGAEGCWAGVAGGCALEACKARVWRVSDLEELHEQPSVKFVTGAEAQRAVSARLHAKQKHEDFTPQNSCSEHRAQLNHKTYK